MQEILARAGAYAHAIQAFLAAHPEIAVPLIGALVTFLCKPRTPAEYESIAKTSPRLAAGLQLFAAIFPDPVKAAKVASKLVTGRNDSLPPPPPVGPVSGEWPTTPKRGDLPRAYDPVWQSFGALAVVGGLMLGSVSVDTTVAAPTSIDVVDHAVAQTPATHLTGCAFLQKHGKDVLSVVQIGCILANQTMPDSKVAEVCDVADEFFEPMQKVLADARKASDAAAAAAVQSTRGAHCGKRLEP